MVAMGKTDDILYRHIITKVPTNAGEILCLKAWKAFHSTMRILKKGNRNTKSSDYTSLVRPILE
jgi:hypothetical protein